MSVWRLTGRTLMFIFLTVLTQVGGLVYVITLTVHKQVIKTVRAKKLLPLIKLAIFLATYLLVTFFIVPIVAKPFGRVQLPLKQEQYLRPLNLLTCVLNRNYVRPELKQTALDVSVEMNAKFPGTIMNYLDAGFPFINKFPLLPHLSHNDGKKLDLAFSYIDAKTNQPSNSSPSFIGYGVCEEPKGNEINTASFCSEKGYWQYSLLKKIVPQSNKEKSLFDSIRTREMMVLFSLHPSIKKIFIEPHLKIRLGLTSDKIRFHGCQAVRHDDHIHVQL